MNIRRNRLRYGTGRPAPGALRLGELAVQFGEGNPTLWIGTPGTQGQTGLARFDGASSSGDLVAQERGGLVYADEQQSSGTTVLLLRTPVRFTLERLSAKTGSGTCDIVIVAGGVAYEARSLSATPGTSDVVFSENDPKIPAGSQIAMTVSNAVNLTSLVVQLDWLEG